MFSHRNFVVVSCKKMSTNLPKKIEFRPFTTSSPILPKRCQPMFLITQQELNPQFPNSKYGTLSISPQELIAVCISFWRHFFRYTNQEKK